MKKFFSYIAVLLGAALLVFAIALPTYVVPKGKVLPLDVVSTTGTAPTPANLLDSSALASGKPVRGNENRPECKAETKPLSCFIAKGVVLQSQRFLTAQEPSNKNEVTMEAGQTLIRTDREEPRNLLSASVDRVTLDRHTQFPVDAPVHTIDITPPAQKTDKSRAAVGPTTRDGISYQFPMGTEKTSYPYFDLQVLKSHPIEFAGEDEKDGVKLYRFEQTVQPTNLYNALEERLSEDGELSEADKSTLGSLRLKFPAAVWGVPTRAEGDRDSKLPAPEDVIEMSRYYTVDRRIWVEPNTGVIVNGQEDVFQYYAADDADAQRVFENKAQEIENPTRTATYLPGAWNEASQQAQLNKASDGLKRMKTSGVVLPWILGPIGLALLILGFVLHRSGRRG